MLRQAAAVAGTLAVLLAFSVPSVVAQPKPTVDVVVEWAMDHEEMELPERGRAQMDLVVHVTGVDFVCSQPLKFKVEIDMGTLPKWAGASPEPRSVPTNGFFIFDGLKPGTTKTGASGSGNTEAKLDIHWDLESAPPKDAVHPYKVRGIVKKESDGVCVGSPTYNTPWTKEMAVRYPDRVEQKAADDVVCLENPSAPGCPVVTPMEAPEDVPAIPALASIAGLVWLVLILRGRAAG